MVTVITQVADGSVSVPMTLGDFERRNAWDYFPGGSL